MNKESKDKTSLQIEVREKVLGYLVAALGLVAGLAWNDAVRALIEQLFPIDRNTMLAKFIYASVITLVVVIFTVYIVKSFKKEIK